MTTTNTKKKKKNARVKEQNFFEVKYIHFTSGFDYIKI